jgi:hypothetical protein
LDVQLVVEADETQLFDLGLELCDGLFEVEKVQVHNHRIVVGSCGSLALPSREFKPPSTIFGLPARSASARKVQNPKPRQLGRST